jgi:hypothetical protein
MFQQGTLLPVLRSRISRSAVWLIAALVLLVSPGKTLAQRGGGRSQPGANSRPVICVHDCLEPHSGLGPDDDRYLEHLMAVQATTEQNTAFTALLQQVQAARTQLQSLLAGVKNGAGSLPSDPTANLDHAIEKARNDTQSFLASFTADQKSGLKDITRKLATADSELDKQTSTFARSLQLAKADAAPVATSGGNLDNALASFQNEQLALGREMSIVLPSDDQELAFILPAVKTLIDLAGQPISIAASGAASRSSVADSHDQFNLRVVADLSDLQQNITGILRALLTNSPRCGERIEIQHAFLTPQEPASLAVVHLHFERWICPGGASPMELASGDGTVEIKLTPRIEPVPSKEGSTDAQKPTEQKTAEQSSMAQNQAQQNSAQQGAPTPRTTLQLSSEFGRIEAQGLLRESLLSGSLGDTLREQIAASFLAALQKGADLKTALPPAAQSATIRRAQFQDAGAGQLRLVLDGQLQLSDEQTAQFAAQLKQRLSAQQTSPQ